MLKESLPIQRRQDLLAMTLSNEKNYAVIDGKALALTWACERLEQYVLRLRFTLETDRKPLVPLLTTTNRFTMPTPSPSPTSDITLPSQDDAIQS